MDINKIKKPIYTDDRSDSHLDRPHLIQRAYIPKKKVDINMPTFFLFQYFTLNLFNSSSQFINHCSFI